MSPPTTTFAQHIRALLDAPGSEDDFALDFPRDAGPELDQQLHQLYDDIDHDSLHHTQVFVTVLHHLQPILPSRCIVSWFETLLRPALREPKLPVAAVDHAKQLVVSALGEMPEFRSRLLDLYLLDAFNAGSSQDVLEWAELDNLQREKKTSWKANLEDILLKYGQDHPLELMNDINEHFVDPSTRLQLLILINLYISVPSFPSTASVMAMHPLLTSLLHSLMFDKSSTACTIALTILVKLLPIFAVNACEALKGLLPQLLSILAKVLCWRERPPSALPQSPEDETPPPQEPDDIDDTSIQFVIRDDISWSILDQSFDGAASVPSPRQYYTLLYYLFPCNVLRFLRKPVAYLAQNKLPSPYTVDWDVALDEQKVRSKSETLLRTHVTHPLIIWRDAAEEISRPDFWAEYDVARIVTEAMMLDVRNTALGLRERHVPQGRQAIEPDTQPISLAKMIATSIALKSNLDVNIAPATEQWPEGLFYAPPSVDDPPSADDRLPPHIAQTMSALQREILMLRSELNFELWLARENVKHVGRLYDARILSRNAEVERQGLYNNLRKYRQQVAALEAELHNNKANASSTKEKFVDYNRELQERLHTFKEEKKGRTAEITELRRADVEKTALLEAQRKLLAAANSELALLETQKKESQHKIDRLHDYERQIEQYIKVQRLWDADFARFNEREAELEELKTERQRLLLRLQSCQENESGLAENARALRRQVQTLEARVEQHRTRVQVPSLRAEEIASFVGERRRLEGENDELMEQNTFLKEEIEGLSAMVEVLKGRPVSTPASPVF